MSSNGTSKSYTNYVAYRDPNAAGQSRIGHLDLEDSTIQPLAFASGGPIGNLYQVIEIGENQIKASGDPFLRKDAEILAPISGRDVLCVGKNYAEHAKEFNSSGYDSSDKVDQPTHPVIFTKRATSIIADGEPIYPHPGFTESADYEGEIGVIIGKSGFRVTEEEAMEHVWGYTIVNDMTARERQRDHKQFYIGKSPDTFCPMGPIAVPANKLPKVLRVQTHVNGEQRQDSTTEDLIFSIPFLVKTLSEGQTLQPGDLLATGTPAGVGIGKKPPVFLKSGDIVKVSVTGLGSLSNDVADVSAANQTIARVANFTHLPTANLSKTNGGIGLTTINSKPLFYRTLGDPSNPPIVFIHGLGGSSEYFTSLITTLNLSSSYACHLLDLEGHGLSPTSAKSIISIASYAADVAALATHVGITSGATVVAHSMGCLVALSLATSHPSLVSKLVLFGPPPSPLPAAGAAGSRARAALVREKGMAAVVDTVVSAGTSSATQRENPLAVAAVRMSLLGQEPEGYAKGCSALAGWCEESVDVQAVKAQVLCVTGGEDKVSPPQVCEGYIEGGGKNKVEVLKDVGHWHLFEDVKGTARAVKAFLADRGSMI